MQETQVQPLVWEDPICLWEDPISLCSIAIELQLLKPTHPGAVLSDKKSHGPEKPTCHN